MNQIKIILILGFFILVIGAQVLKKPTLQAPIGWPNVSYDFSKNPLSQEKIDLGKMLFFDPRLSSDKQISCASCHSPYNAFAHTDHPTSHGVHDRIGKRNAPPLFNLAWHKSYMWDGAIHHLDAQALAPITDFNEMNSSINEVIELVKSNNEYIEKHKAAWPSQAVSGQTLLLSISAFLLTLVSDNSKYDRVKKGIDEFSLIEKKGYELFKLHCTDCHTEPLFSSFEYQNNGIEIVDSTEWGHGRITQNSSDQYRFKIPSLRNLDFTFPYMHDGRYKSLREVMNHYGNNDLLGIHLSSDQKVELLSFLNTLNDQAFCSNKNNHYPFHLLNPSSP